MSLAIVEREETTGERKALDEKAIEALVEDHMPLVQAVARGWRARCRTTLDYEDLLQAGALGLVQAARRFDPARTSAFAAFAAERIRGAICDFLREADPVTRGRRQAVRSLDSTAARLRVELQREPRAEELASALGWTPEATEQARGDVAALASGWATVCEAPSDDAGAPLATDRSGDDPFETLARSEQRAWLVREIAELPERERLVLAMSYLEPDELTLKEIGEILGVTESRACQLRTAALRRLREKLEDAAPRRAVGHR